MRMESFIMGFDAVVLQSLPMVSEWFEDREGNTHEMICSTGTLYHDLCVILSLPRVDSFEQRQFEVIAQRGERQNPSESIEAAIKKVDRACDETGCPCACPLPLLYFLFYGTPPVRLLLLLVRQEELLGLVPPLLG